MSISWISVVRPTSPQWTQQASARYCFHSSNMCQQNALKAWTSGKTLFAFILWYHNTAGPKKLREQLPNILLALCVAGGFIRDCWCEFLMHNSAFSAPCGQRPPLNISSFKCHCCCHAHRCSDTVQPLANFIDSDLTIHAKMLYKNSTLAVGLHSEGRLDFLGGQIVFSPWT